MFYLLEIFYDASSGRRKNVDRSRRINLQSNTTQLVSRQIDKTKTLSTNSGHEALHITHGFAQQVSSLMVSGENLGSVTHSSLCFLFLLFPNKFFDVWSFDVGIMHLANR